MDDGRPRAANTPAGPPANAPGRVQQPKPQALPSRSGPSSILVSPRQKGNPILNSVRTVAWEYSDIPADYVVGATTCALFLSLKYHRLHPEYIYNRIRDLKGQYTLRILLTMVDIENHEDPLRELSKTSLVNNVTVMLCWSAQEAGRYLELFKTFENAAPTTIRAHQSSSYPEKMVEFITAPRSINKTDAVGLVSNFGSIRTAINASPEEIGLVAGWGDKKVQRWCTAVREPFRVQKAARRTLTSENTQATMSRHVSIAEGAPLNTANGDAEGSARQALDQAASHIVSTERLAQAKTARRDADERRDRRLAEELDHAHLAGEEQAARETTLDRPTAQSERSAASSKPAKRKQVEEELSEGISNELRIEITSYLANTDNKNVRLTCMAYYEAATQHLFRSVLICPRERALVALYHISSRPNLASCVKEIVFDGSLYSDTIASSKDNYYRAENEWANGPISGHAHPSDPDYSRWRRYWRLFAEQQGMQIDEGLLRTFATEALNHFPKIVSIVYSPTPRSIPVEAQDLGGLIPRSFMPGGESMYSKSDHPFRQLIAAIYWSECVQIREFKVDAGYAYAPGTSFSIDLFRFAETTDRCAYLYFFQNLTKLELNVTMPFLVKRIGAGGAPEDNDVKQVENLARMINSAEKLQCLSLEINPWGVSTDIKLWSRRAHTAFRELGLNATWKDLKSLSLLGIGGTEEEFTQIINRHDKTLEAVCFKHCSFKHGFWANIADQVMANTRIVSFGLFYNTDQAMFRKLAGGFSDVERYLLYYCGQLEVVEAGERTFVNTGSYFPGTVIPEIKSVYEGRKLVTEELLKSLS
ncbi:hypothetical protein IQ07DRAFT_566533 [Pyrenochaeta sp. DS3sAY3a]|nr:hypothetical protein IQ07DRAFT_566533 [Pyrenochaeta sp. DS3sAY3a]